MYDSLAKIIVFLTENPLVTTNQLNAFGVTRRWINSHIIEGILKKSAVSQYKVDLDRLTQHYRTHIPMESGVWHRHTQSFSPKTGVSEAVWRAELTARIQLRANIDNLLINGIVFSGNTYKINFVPGRCNTLIVGGGMHVVFDSVEQSVDALKQLTKSTAAQGKWELSAYYAYLQTVEPVNPAISVLDHLKTKLKKYTAVAFSEGHAAINPLPKTSKNFYKVVYSLAHFSHGETILFDKNTRTLLLSNEFLKKNREIAVKTFLTNCEKMLDSAKIRSITFRALPYVGGALSTLNVICAQDTVQAAIKEVAVTAGAVAGGAAATLIAGASMLTPWGLLFVACGSMIGGVTAENMISNSTSSNTASCAELKLPLFDDQYPRMRIKYVENQDPFCALSANFPTFRHYKYAVLEDGTLAMSPKGTSRDVARGKPVLAAGELNLLGSRIYINTNTRDYNVVMTDQLKNLLIEKIKFNAENQRGDVIVCTNKHSEKTASIIKKLSIAIEAFKRESAEKSVSFYQSLSDSFLEKKYIDLTSQIKILDSDVERFSRVIAEMKSLIKELSSLYPELDEYDLGLYTVDSCIADIEKHRTTIQAAANVARSEQKNICAAKASAAAALLEVKVRAELTRPYAVLVERKQKELEAAEAALASRRELERQIEAKKAELAMAQLEKQKANQRAVAADSAAKEADRKLSELKTAEQAAKTAFEQAILHLLEASRTADAARIKADNCMKASGLSTQNGFLKSTLMPTQLTAASSLPDAIVAINNLIKNTELKKNENWLKYSKEDEAFEDYIFSKVGRRLPLLHNIVEAHPSISTPDEFYKVAQEYLAGDKDKKHWSEDALRTAIELNQNHDNALCTLGVIAFNQNITTQETREAGIEYLRRAREKGNVAATAMMQKIEIMSPYPKYRYMSNIEARVLSGQLDFSQKDIFKVTSDSSSNRNNNDHDHQSEYAGNWGARGGSDMWGGGSRSGNSGGHNHSNENRHNGSGGANCTFTHSDKAGDHYAMNDGSGNFTLSGTSNDPDRSYSGFDGMAKCHQVSREGGDGRFGYKCNDGQNILVSDGRDSGGSSVCHSGWDSDRGCFATPDPWGKN